ncbi:methyltransferase domain-containing protein [uncultured Limosilactobacillus sp.]|uniref:methyltransferase domain-containing protein n=1 Tax=uncultured Limosilactobacillus sp. TaxID=2837629 RepID=UPI0025F2A5D6|nr:methyltransferase domain-containing protein [uncultured Limosilactobacillus sp.]
MKKIEKTIKWLNNHLAMLRCPVCQAPFIEIKDQQLGCVNHHQLNINKHGYVYFLQKGVKTEYDRDILVARRQLLSAGLFKGIIDAIDEELGSTPQTILDVGSGEGTPLFQLQQRRHSKDNAYVGFDISRPGVQLATQLSDQLFFCLADLRQLPFRDNSFTSIIELFSPSDYQEFHRVLQPGGKIVKVIPNSKYLKELRQLLYSTKDKHQQYDNTAVKKRFAKSFNPTQIKQVHYQFEVPNRLRAAMVQMSPLHWGKEARQLTINEIAQLTTVTVDVELLIGKQK